MKTQAQIKAYLKNVRPKREIDGMAIRQYCSDCGVGIPAYTLPKDSKRTPITYDEFKNWVGDNSPSTGEVVVLETDGSIGLVRNSGYRKIAFHAMVSADGKFQSQNTVCPRSAYRIAADEERMVLQRGLSLKNLDYCRRKDMLVDKFIPSEGKYVRITLLGKRIGIGIFQRIDTAGNIVMYVFRKEETPDSYSTYQSIGPKQNYQFENISQKDRECLNMLLNTKSYIWNGYSKRIEPKGLRCSKKVSYFYINNYFEVTVATEKKTKSDLNRFRSLNYFIRQEDALTMLAYLRPNQAVTRSKSRESYFYIDNFYSVKEAIDFRRPRHTKRFQAGNYFLDRESAEKYLRRYIELRKIKLLEAPANGLEAKSKRGRKPKQL